MPNAPKTPLRSIRVDTDLWRAAQAVAAARGESLSDVIRRALVRYEAAVLLVAEPGAATAPAQLAHELLAQVRLHRVGEVPHAQVGGAAAVVRGSRRGHGVVGAERSLPDVEVLRGVGASGAVNAPPRPPAHPSPRCTQT